MHGAWLSARARSTPFSASSITYGSVAFVSIRRGFHDRHGTLIRPPRSAVLRYIRDAGPGVLINWRRGSPDPAVFDQANAQVCAAAFWDALIGQQDRHATNFRYDAETRRLALIDNAFAFARPNDLHNQSLFLAYRRSAHMVPLNGSERTALETILGSDDLLGLRLFISEDRADAFEARARAMLERKMLPLPGAF